MTQTPTNQSEQGRPPHGRRLGLIGVSLTTARSNKHDIQALSAVRDQVERLLVDTGYLEGAPFHWVTIAIKYGIKYSDTPIYQRISKKYGDLPLSMEVDTRDLTGASVIALEAIFKKAVLLALMHAGNKHQRPVEQLLAELSSMQ